MRYAFFNKIHFNFVPIIFLKKHVFSHGQKIHVIFMNNSTCTLSVHKKKRWLLKLLFD
jgi:hypothetical protein